MVSLQKPLVTVVTVTYNSAAYVRDAIESVLSQSYENIEYIIGDDNSSDATWSIINEYNDLRIISYKNEVNLKEYPNRNKAIEMATGKYLIFIDGDDLIYPHAVDFLVNMSEAFPETGMTLMQAYRQNIFYPAVVSPRVLYVAEFFDKSFLDTAFTNSFFKTQVLREFGGLDNSFVSGDTAIRLKIARKYNCLLVNDNLTWWRITPGQASIRVSDFDEILAFHFFRKELLTEESPLSGEERKIAQYNLNVKLLRIAITAIIKGSLINGIRLLWNAKLLLMLPLAPFTKPISIDPFVGYSSTNIFREEISKNPYSKFNKRDR